MIALLQLTWSVEQNKLLQVMNEYLEFGFSLLYSISIEFIIKRCAASTWEIEIAGITVEKKSWAELEQCETGTTDCCRCRHGTPELLADLLPDIPHRVSRYGGYRFPSLIFFTFSNLFSQLFVKLWTEL